MNCSTPGLPVHHQLPELTQIHVHGVSDAIQPSHPLTSPSPPAFNLSQNQGPFKWVISSSQVPKDWNFSFSISPSSEYSWLISFRVDWLDLLAVQGTLKSLLQHHSSKVSILQHSAFLYRPTLTSIRDYWKNHSFDVTDLCWQSDISIFNMLSRLVIAFLPRSKCLLISWLQAPSALILELPKIKSATVSTASPSVYLCNISENVHKIFVSTGCYGFYLENGVIFLIWKG